MTEKKNALWFFIAVLGGGLAVLFAKSEFANAWIAAGVAGTVVFLLMIYYWLNDEDAPEEEGDNVYYLGLLFTLLSLMFALVELFGNEADARGNAERIRVLLENFGIALTSTVVGIFGRVWLLNWQWSSSSGVPEGGEKPSAKHTRSRLPWTRSSKRPETVDDNRPTVSPPGSRSPGRQQPAGDKGIVVSPPRSASAEDLEAFNRQLLGRIARDLTEGANALARFSRIVRSHASDTEEILQSHSEALKRESVEFRDALQSNADAFAQELKQQAERSLETVGRSLGEVGRQAETVLESVRAAQERHSAEVSAMARSFHDELQSASRQSLDALGRNFDTAAQQATALPERLSAAHDGYLEEIRAATRSAQDELQSASRQGLDTLGRSFDTAAQQAAALPERLSAAHAGYLEEIRAATRSTHDDIQSASGQSLQALQRNQEAAAQQAAAFVQQLTEVNERIEKSLAGIDAGLARAGGASAALGQSAELAAKSAESLKAGLESLHRALGPLSTQDANVSGLVDAMGDLEARIREGRDAEQTATAVQRIEEIFQAITAEAAAAREQATGTAELMDRLKGAVQENEAEMQHAAGALRGLANEAEARTKELQQSQSAGWRIWNRSG